MKKNKNQPGLSFNVIIIAALTLIVLTILIAVFTKNPDFMWNKYNPEEDVCEKGICQIESQYFTNTYDEKDIEEKNAKEKCLDWDGDFICKNWRPKTHCEKNPNDEERCVCDKYTNYFSPTDYIKGYCIYQELRGINGWNCSICIKAHEKNECEKGNPNWVWDDNKKERMDFCENQYEKCMITINKENICLNEVKYPCIKTLEKKIENTCRKRTIQDLTCEELRGCYLNNTACFDDEASWKERLKLEVEYIDRCGK